MSHQLINCPDWSCCKGRNKLKVCLLLLETIFHLHFKSKGQKEAIEKSTQLKQNKKISFLTIDDLEKNVLVFFFSSVDFSIRNCLISPSSTSTTRMDLAIFILSQPDRERQILYNIAYMWSIKKKDTKNELIYKTEVDSQT